MCLPCLTKLFKSRDSSNRRQLAQQGCNHPRGPGTDTNVRPPQTRPNSPAGRPRGENLPEPQTIPLQHYATTHNPNTEGLSMGRPIPDLGPPAVPQTTIAQLTVTPTSGAGPATAPAPAPAPSQNTSDQSTQTVAAPTSGPAAAETIRPATSTATATDSAPAPAPAPCQNNASQRGGLAGIIKSNPAWEFVEPTVRPATSSSNEDNEQNHMPTTGSAATEKGSPVTSGSNQSNQQNAELTTGPATAETTPPTRRPATLGPTGHYMGSRWSPSSSEGVPVRSGDESSDESFIRHADDEDADANEQDPRQEEGELSDRDMLPSQRERRESGRLK